jgi:hypothetical protein
MKKLLLSLLLICIGAQSQTFPVVNLTASGWIRNATGAVGTPTYGFTGATTTGLYWANPGIGFSVAGSSAGSILSTGWNGAVVATTISASTPIPKDSGGTGNTSGTATINANLTGVITSVGNATSIGAQTGTGSTFVVQTSPTINTPILTAPALGTPASGIATNLTGTATALNIGGNAATATTATTTTNIAGGANGSLPYQTGSGTTTFLAVGSNTNVLTLAGGVPTWSSGGLINPMTTLGDTIIGGASGAPTRLAIGSTNNIYTVVAGSPAWASSISSTPISGSTGSFTTLAASSTVSGTGFSTYLASPPAIGGTAAAAISGTTLTATTGAITPHYPTGILGSTSAAAVSAGSIGEIFTAIGTNTSLSSSSVLTIASITPTAGNWELTGSCAFNAAASTTSSLFKVGINTTTNTLPADPLFTNLTGTFAAATSEAMVAPTQFVNSNGSVVYGINAISIFAVSTMTATCRINAIRTP